MATTFDLVRAAHRGDIRTVNQLIAAGVDINGDKYSVSPLYTASEMGHLEIVKILLKIF